MTVDAPAPQRARPDDSATHARARRWVRRLWDSHPAGIGLGVAVVVWIATFSFLVVRRHDRFWDVDFDMGIHDQAIWLLARGRRRGNLLSTTTRTARWLIPMATCSRSMVFAPTLSSERIAALASI